MAIQAKQISRLIETFMCEQDGAAATEYAILLALIALAAVGAVAIYGEHVAGTASSVSAGLAGGSDIRPVGPASTMTGHVTTSMP